MEQTNLTTKEKVVAVLRWIALAPAMLIGWELGFALGKLFNLMQRDFQYGHFISEILSDIIGSIVCLYIARWVAPSHKGMATLVSAIVLSTIIAVLTAVSIILNGFRDWQGFVGVVVIVITLISTGISLYKGEEAV